LPSSTEDHAINSCVKVKVNQSVMGICGTDIICIGIKSLQDLLTEFATRSALSWAWFCICKGILGAHGGRITVEKPQEFKRSDVYTSTMQSFTTAKSSKYISEYLV
jgi:hypothetical protein